MNETTMTLEELCQYAQEAKEQTEKEVAAERQNLIAKKNEAFSSIIKYSVDKLKTRKGREVTIISTGTAHFRVDDTELETPVEIDLAEIKNLIGVIPALKVDMHESDSGRMLKVTFSKTEETEMLETDGSEDK